MKKLLILIMFIGGCAFAQTPEELLIKVNENPNDPVAYQDLSRAYRSINPDSSVLLSRIAIKKSIQNKDWYNEGMSYGSLATAYNYIQNGFDSSIKYFEIGLAICVEHGDREKEARFINNLGISYDYEGQFDVALEYYLKALKIYEELDFKQGISEAKNNVGLMYDYLGEYEKALEFYKASCDLGIELKDTLGWAYSLANMATVFIKLDSLSKAEELFIESIELRLIIGAENTMATVYNSLSSVYMRRGDKEKALELMLKALEINKANNRFRSLATSHYNIGFLYHDFNQLDKAKYHYEQAIELSKNHNYLVAEQQYQFGLLEVSEELKDYKTALGAAKRYMNINDSLFTKQKQEAMLNLKESFDAERRELQIKEQNATIEKQRIKSDLEASNSRKKSIILYFSLGILAVVVFFAFMLANRIKLVSRQKKEIELQKLIVDEKNKEITDSIEYAKRIQSAILPPVKLIKSQFEDSFVLYLPKDIVAGDFYWMYPTEDSIFYAVADCTGHGVPGAMVSVVCNEALNRSLKEFDLRDPGKILDKVTELVQDSFSQSEEEIKDGMDIALCKLSKDKNKLEFAGANNGIYIIRDKELIEFKGDKQPIGKYEGQKEFKTVEIDLYENDCLYIFSDGFADQFGGPKGKKFKYKPFKELLVKNVSSPMDQQKETVLAAFEYWKADFEQVDDVCVIGVRV